MMKLKQISPILLVSILIYMLSGCMKAPVEFYISPAGSDDNPGTIDQPFGSLEKARDEIRKLNQADLRSDVNVYLRGGTYFLGKTFILDLEDSAHEGYTITYRAYNEEEVILSSGIKINGWKIVEDEISGLPAVAEGKVWEAKVPTGLGRFLTLYDGNKRLPRARTTGFMPTSKHPDKQTRFSYDRYTLEYPEGALRNWPNLEDVELIVIPSYPWSMNILSLESVDEENRIARTTIPATYPMRQMPRWVFDRPEFAKTCWLENVPEGLDSPGKWMLNTFAGKVYLWPEGDAPSDKIYAPSLRELIRVEGKNDPDGNGNVPVQGIVLEGLTFTQADRGVWDEDDVGIQHDWEMLDKDNAMLRFRGAENCLVKGCRFFNAGGNGIRMDLYAQHITIQNCLFHHLGQSAVMMIGYGPGTKDVNKFNTVKNNYIHHCGEIYWHSQMITAWQSGHNYIGHNYLHDIPRKAVCISGVRASFLWPEKKDLRECGKSIRWHEIGNASTWEEFLPFLHARNNLIEYNEVHHALEMLGDGAVINLSGGGDNNIVRNNYVHHILTGNASGCIRMDGYQRKTLVENNVVFTSGVAGICPKGENTIRNNYIINVCIKRNMGCIRGFGNTQEISNLEQNIVYNPHKDKDLLFYHSIEGYSEEEYRAKTIDNNIYYNPHRKLEENPNLLKLMARGAESNSLYEDPLFEDWEKGDFKLKKESPAHQLGIKQIDLSKVGLMADFPNKYK